MLQFDERILDLLAYLLEARRPVPASAIFEAFPDEYAGSPDARERKLSRDKEALRNLGFPLTWVAPDDDDEESGGYVLDREQTFLPDIPLTPEERAALFAVGAAARAGAFPMKSELARALSKLRASSPGGDEVSATSIVATPSRRPEIESVLMKAVAGRRRVKLKYPPEQAVRVVEPYAFSARRGRFHLVGYCHLREGVRTFASDRISGCKLENPGATKPEFEVPEGFDPAPHLPHHPWQVRRHPAVEVELRFSEELADSGPRALGLAPGEKPRVTNLDGLANEVLALGDGVRVVGPEEAVAAVHRALDALAAAHGGEA